MKKREVPLLWKKVLRELGKPGAFLTRASYSRLWFVGSDYKDEHLRLHVQEKTVEAMRREGLVVMREYPGNVMMLGLPELRRVERKKHE